MSFERYKHTEKEYLEIDHHESRDTHQHKSHVLQGIHDYSLGDGLSLLSRSEQESDPEVYNSYVIAAVLMVGATLWWTVAHIDCKYVYSISPYINGFDTTSFQGYYIASIYYILAKYKGHDMSLFSLQPKVAVILIARILVGACLNLWINNGLMYVPVSKGILIFSLNPLFCAIAAAIFLREHITLVSILSTLGAFFGIYLLTLNKPDDVQEAGREMIGYLLVLGSAIWYGLLFVFLRTLNLYKMSIFMSPFYLGMSALVQTIIIFIFKRDLLNIEKYTFSDFWYMSIFGLAWTGGQILMLLANKYGMASKMAPISFLENVFTLLADIFIFSYQFVGTDMFGMTTIVIWLAVPIILKIMGKDE